tara:strand:+ start:7132 stop:7392 length:261 start_codon:yes stop_codon:yes gene_type:complete
MLLTKKMTEITAVDTPPPAPDAKKEEGVPILTVEVKDQDTALKLMVNFLEIANRRGAFSIAEVGKIHECIKMFTPEPEPAPMPQVD